MCLSFGRRLTSRSTVFEVLRNGKTGLLMRIDFSAL